MNDVHTTDNIEADDVEESETFKIENLNETIASQMNKLGINAEAIPIGSLNLEAEEYYNNDIGSSPRFTTNRGCIRIKDKEVKMIQVIQRF